MNIHCSDDCTTMTVTDIESKQLLDIFIQEVQMSYELWKGVNHAGKYKKNKI